MTLHPPPPEWHRPLPLLRLSAGVHTETITSERAECAALATRMGLPAIKSVRCVFTLHPRRDGVFLAEGHLQARITQTCVVTLDPFAAAIDERFRVLFVPAGQESETDDPESDDEIPYEGTAIDLGEAAAEQLALALDPYPRKPDAVIAESGPDEVLEVEGKVSPFAALARLRGKP